MMRNVGDLEVDYGSYLGARRGDLHANLTIL